ncbi:hypothetical protein FOA52_008897 [Chlamydomonas sp. UWO 241]|nr:hypothetical protein FOA52_008897 [Chlamydomonas sp. UWO 241]
MLHKSLSDWLLHATISGSHAVDSRLGHRLLGSHLLTMSKKALESGNDTIRNADSSLKLPSYASKYMVLHMCRAGPSGTKLLEEVLRNWEIMQQIFVAGDGGHMLAALGEVAAGKLTPYCRDAQRWISRCQHDLQMHPETTENITFLFCPFKFGTEILVTSSAALLGPGLGDENEPPLIEPQGE